VAARKPSATNAATELAFVAAAGVLGWLRAPLYLVGLLTVAMVAYWMWNRRAGLKKIADKGIVQLAASSAVSLGLIFVFLALAYGLGHVIPGGTS
jgi:AmiR/NasT family two-component response regulator